MPHNNIEHQVHQLLNSIFHIPHQEDKLSPHHFHSIHHSYHYFLQTIGLIHVPAFASSLRLILQLCFSHFQEHVEKKVYQNNDTTTSSGGSSSSSLLSDVLRLLFERLRLYKEQYELCRESIKKEQAIPHHLYKGNQFKIKRKVESLKRQAQELEVHAIEVFDVFLKHVQSFINHDLRTTSGQKEEQQETFTSSIIVDARRLVIKWLLDSCFELSVPCLKSTKSEHDEDGSEDGEEENHRGDAFPSKKQKRSEEIEFASGPDALQVIGEMERDMFCQNLLALLKLSVSDQLSTNTFVIDGVNQIQMLQSRDAQIHSIRDALSNEIDVRYEDLMWAVSCAQHQWICVYLALQYPFPITSYSLASILIITHKELGNWNSLPNLFDESILIRMLSNMYGTGLLKKFIVIFECVCQKYPKLIRTFIGSHLNDLLIQSRASEWTYQNELFFALFLTLIAECKGFLNIFTKDLIEFVKERIGQNTLAFVPYHVEESRDDVFGYLLCRRIDELADQTFNCLSALMSLSETHPNQSVKSTLEACLMRVIALYQRNVVLLNMSETQDVSRNIDEKSLRSIAEISNNTQDVLKNLIQDDKDHTNNKWLFIAELLGLSSITTATNIMIYIISNFAWNSIGSLFINLFNTFSINLHDFDQNVIDKMFFEISAHIESHSETDDSTSVNILNNLCEWVQYLKFKSEQSFVYKHYLYRMIIMNWQTFYPYLFHEPREPGVNPMNCLTMIHTTLEELNLHRKKIPKYILSGMASAVVSFFVFVLEPLPPKNDQVQSMETNSSSNNLDYQRDKSNIEFYRDFVSGYEQRGIRIDSLKNELCTILSQLVQSNPKITDSLFNFVFNIIFARHSESRLHSQDVVMSRQIYEQCHFPLQEYSSIVELLNDSLPKYQNQQGQYNQPDFLFSHWHKKPQKTKTEKTKPSLLRELSTMINPEGLDINHANTDLLNDLQARGVVIVNPQKVHMHLTSRSLARRSNKNAIDIESQKLIERNSASVIHLITVCLSSPDATQYLSSQLFNRLRIYSLTTTYEQYCKSLPKKPMFEKDIFLAKMFLKFPILYSILDLIAEYDPERLLAFDFVIFSLIVNLIGDWSLIVPQSKKVSEERSLMNRTLLILSILNKGQWIRRPFTFLTDLVPHVSAHSMIEILTTIFHYINRHPLQSEQLYNKVRLWPKESEVRNEDMKSIKEALRRHVVDVPTMLFSLFYDGQE